MGSTFFYERPFGAQHFAQGYWEHNVNIKCFCLQQTEMYNYNLKVNIHYELIQMKHNIWTLSVYPNKGKQSEVREV